MSDVLQIEELIRARGARLNPPASLQAIEAFEAQHGISLPSDYRAFILTFGDGGDGPPSYGLLPLGVTDPACVPEWFASGYAGLLAQPFPLRSSWVWEGEPEGSALEQRLATLRHGSLCLGTDGCGLFWLLVVSGPERGQIWQLADVGITPLAPRLTFLPWYTYWLNGGDDWFRE